MERVAVQAQIEIIEPAGERPCIAARHGDRRNAGGLQLLAGVEKLVPRFRLAGNAGLLEQILAIEHAPRVVHGRRGVLLALIRRRFLRRRIHVVPAVLRPVAAQVFEQAALRVVRHAFAVMPVDDIGRDGREPAGQLHLVRFFIDERHLHVDIGMRLLELVDHRLPDRALACALERDVDRERAGLRRRADDRDPRRRGGQRECQQNLAWFQFHVACLLYSLILRRCCYCVESSSSPAASARTIDCHALRRKRA